jgi:hypothetical protein
MNRTLRVLARPFVFLASVFGWGPRCGHRSQLLPGYGDMPVTCQLRPGHFGRWHRDGIAMWPNDKTPGAHRGGGPS